VRKEDSAATNSYYQELARWKVVVPLVLSEGLVEVEPQSPVSSSNSLLKSRSGGLKDGWFAEVPGKMRIDQVLRVS
jgi:hypothetical protein